MELFAADRARIRDAEDAIMRRRGVVSELEMRTRAVALQVPHYCQYCLPGKATRALPACRIVPKHAFRASVADYGIYGTHVHASAL